MIPLLSNLSHKTILIFIITMFLSISSQQQNNQSTNKQQQPEYSENIDDFKGKQAGIRTQKLLGCWLYIDQELNFQIEQIDRKISMSSEQLPIFKECIRKISRKQAILQITALAQKNMQEIKPFQTILEAPLTKQHLYSKQIPNQLTQFDHFLLNKAKQFQIQLKQMLMKGGIKDQVEEQINKRQKLFLGFIPATIVTHASVLVLSAVMLMCCCTWCKFYKSSEQERRVKRLTRRGGNKQLIKQSKASATRKINRKKL